MEYTYMNVDGKMTIKTPGITSTEQIKTEVLKHDASGIITRLTYPNGFIIESDICPTSIMYKCNQPLKDCGNGVFVAPTDE